MKMYEISTLVIIITLATLAAVGIISSKFLGDDNPVEEAIEQIIKEKTTLDIDLSPKTIEEQKKGSSISN